MKYKILYENISRINQGILLNFSYINLQYSKLSLNFVNFLYKNGLILNYIVKKNYIILFFKFLKQSSLLKKISVDSNLRLWRWYRYKQLINSKNLFLRKYKKSELCFIIFYTSKGFLFYETALLKSLGGRYICQLKI